MSHAQLARLCDFAQTQMSSHTLPEHRQRLQVLLNVCVSAIPVVGSALMRQLRQTARGGHRKLRPNHCSPHCHTSLCFVRCALLSYRFVLHCLSGCFQNRTNQTHISGILFVCVCVCVFSCRYKGVVCIIWVCERRWKPAGYMALLHCLGLMTLCEY